MELNDAISNFPYKWSDKTNRPHLIPANFSTRKSVGGNAHENWCLLRLLPLIIGLKVPQQEPVWQMLMTLKDIVDLVMSRVHTEESICYLDSIISEHRSRFLDVSPQHKLIPKHHFLEHYPQLIREFGPLAALWTMRFEAKHSFFKKVLLPVDMAPSAKLRIIFGEDDVHKLLLPAGIPSTLQDLNDVLRETFDITGPFTVMYQDMDFDGQFFTLTSIEEVQDKANLKVVKTEPVILSLTTVDMSEVESPVPLSTEASSSSVCDTILLSSPDESGPSYRSKPWPFKFEIPDFSYDIDLALEAGKQAYENDGTLLNNPSVTSSILEKLAETIFGFTAYPTGVQILAVAEALVAKYPCLKEPGSFNGLYGWQQRIKYKMGNYRAKLRGRQLAIPELEVNTLKRRCSSEEGSLKGFKRAKKAEVNYLPPLPFGETEETLEMERLDLLKEMKKKNNERAINEKMEKSFAMRRKEVVKDCPAIQDLLERWPSLFCENQIKEEFKRITTIHLERTFLSRLDGYTTKLLEIFRRKGGTAGTKIKPMLDSLNKHHVDGRRDIIIRCLVEYLGESGEELIKDHQEDVSQEALKEDCSNHMMKIIVIHPNVAQENQDPVNVSVIIEGTEILEDCGSVTNACLLLMGVIYAVNLSYPLKLKYTFEAFQKLFLELDILKMSPKVQSLHKKLLA
ncbi:uncharacterized protein LOC113035558 [Astatotilapia calliptera]|uniref:uncharacterized protein LOC113035558 n=1 Tax=Astatotilapia calliptera TaxID=8154 RepID=UPI000E414EDB|nr:uncharacterized protein LOC113035558 [Astatotilapia calliptera]